MRSMVQDLEMFLLQPLLALVEVTSARGSTPREQGAWMLVSPRAIFGTIGGGQLEYMAIDKAREMLRTLPSPLWGGSASERNEVELARRGGGPSEHPTPITPTPTLRGDPPHRGEGKVTLSIPLGPEIGQCCGGRVELAIRIVDDAIKGILLAEDVDAHRKRPHVYVFGGGHVGHALANAMALLPIHATIVETRAEELRGLPDAVETRLTAMPEEVVREAPAGSAFLILTHDHALDFLVAAEALKRKETAYVGMIGSKSKKATFRTWFLKNAGGTEAEFARLVSPIGGDAVKDKRPAIIAALAAAELVTVLLRDVVPSEAMVPDHSRMR
jgi:xanthine dehydrogenase accessory factor